MGALFDNPTMVEHYDLVGILNSGKTMGDNQRGAPLKKFS